MRLRHAVLAGGISGLALFGTDLAPASYAPLKLRTHFLSACPFKWIGTTVEHQRTADRD
jgi:hypothetical protein